MEQQFSLSWNNFHGNLSKGFAGLLGKGEFVDVTLAVDGHLLQAHKVVLSICSPYFKKMFQTNPCQHPIVVLRDVTHKAMQDLLQFMYHGEVSVKQEDLTGFIKVADVLQIKGLTNKETDEENEETTPKSNIPSTLNNVNTNSNQRRSVDNINTIYADELTHNEQIEILHQRQLLDKLNKLSALKRKSEEYIQHNFCTKINMLNENYNSGEKRPKLKEKLISNRHNVVSESQTKPYDVSANVSSSYEEALRSEQSNENHNLNDNVKPENATLENGLLNLKSECEDIIVTDPAAHDDITGSSENNNTLEENRLQHDLVASPRMHEDGTGYELRKATDLNIQEGKKDRRLKQIQVWISDERGGASVDELLYVPNSQHTIVTIPQKEDGKKKYPQRSCRACWRGGRRRDTRFMCSVCNIPFCKSPCFEVHLNSVCTYNNI